MKWYLKVLKNYAGFSGRARRKEFWMFTLFNSILAIIAAILDNIAGTTLEDLPFGLFYYLYTIPIFIPALAVSVRRLHDIGKSGWYYLVIFIPIAGVIWYLILVSADGEPYENEYGVNPKTKGLDSINNGDANFRENNNPLKEGDQKLDQITNLDTKPKLANATGILVLGISSILTFSTVILGLICGIIALVMCRKPMEMLKKNPEGFSNAKMLTAGRVTAIIGIVLSVLYVPMVLLFIALDN